MVEEEVDVDINIMFLHKFEPNVLGFKINISLYYIDFALLQLLNAFATLIYMGFLAPEL